MKQYCIDCGERLPNVWPWIIANQDGRCAACDDALWASDDTQIHPGAVEACPHCRPDGLMLGPEAPSE